MVTRLPVTPGPSSVMLICCRGLAVAPPLASPPRLRSILVLWLLVANVPKSTSRTASSFASASPIASSAVLTAPSGVDLFSPTRPATRPTMTDLLVHALLQPRPAGSEPTVHAVNEFRALAADASAVRLSLRTHSHGSPIRGHNRRRCDRTPHGPQVSRSTSASDTHTCGLRLLISPVIGVAPLRFPDSHRRVPAARRPSPAGG